MMRPAPRAFRDGTAAREVRNTERTLTAMMRSNSSSVVSSKGLPSAMPALFTKMSKPPNCALAAATTSSALPSAVTSSAKQCTFGPLNMASRPCPGKSVRTTRAPSDIYSLAMASPMPLAAPVMMATLPSSLPMLSPCCADSALMQSPPKKNGPARCRPAVTLQSGRWNRPDR